MITVNINGKEIKLEKSITVLEAARSVGIKIPTLCWHKQLERYGGCRLCLVEVEKIPKLQTACTLMVTDGMAIKTETEQIAEARRGILEFLLINHPLDCPYCDKAGECELQDLVEKYGPTKGRFKEAKRKVPESLDDPIIVRNMERCVMCTRCVRMCEGVQGASAIGVIGRGGHSHIEPFSAGKYDCEYCGNCISACPVGAIMSRLHRHAYRPWQLTAEIETICGYCGVGCTLKVQVRDDVIKRVVPCMDSPVNGGLLCSRGRFGYEFVGNKERLDTPLIKVNGVLEKASWEEAINFAASKLAEIKEKYGGSSIAGLASPRCTNEDNYVFQKFMRIAIGTNNIDSTARTGFAGVQRFIENIFGQGATSNTISALSVSDLIFIIGGDPTAINPILGLQIRACSRKGGKILSLEKLKGLKFFNPAVLTPVHFTDDVLLEGIITILKDKKGLNGRNPALESRIKEINTQARNVEETCGISQSALAEFVNQLSASTSPAIVIGKDLIQDNNGSYKLLLVSAIAYLIEGKMYLLSERPNEQGLLDMGCAPDILPGHMPLSVSEVRKKYEDVWKASITASPGLTLFEMIDAAQRGALKAMYIMGENPVFNLPDSKAVEDAFKKIDFVVVQDIFLNETGKLADVVLPSLSWGEKDGTFTNLERRIQRLRKAVHRDGMDDWKIITEIAKSIGIKMTYANTEEIFAEISAVSPLYNGITYKDVDKGNMLYPYKAMPVKRIAAEIQINKVNERPSNGKLYLMLERPLFHSGTLSRKSSALMKIYPQAVARISDKTANALSLKNGDMVKVSTKKGSLELPVIIDDMVGASYVMLTNNFEGKGAFSLLSCQIDPVTKAPIIEGMEVSLSKGGG